MSLSRCNGFRHTVIHLSKFHGIVDEFLSWLLHLGCHNGDHAATHATTTHVHIRGAQLQERARVSAQTAWLMRPRHAHAENEHVEGPSAPFSISRERKMNTRTLFCHSRERKT